MNKPILFLQLALVINTLAGPPKNPRSIEYKLDAVVIPALELRNSSAVEALEYLVSSVADTPPRIDRASGGIDTIMDSREILDRSLSATSNLPPLTINLRRIKARHALDYITEILRLKYKVTDTTILFFTEDDTLLNKNE